MLSPDINIRIDLNSDTFTPADRDELAEQLSTETDLRIESDVAAYTGVDNSPLPPDVAIYILHTLVPIADVYANVLASAIWERIQAALSRRGDYEPGVPTVTVVEVVGEDGSLRRDLRIEGQDQKTIREAMRQFGKDRQ